MQYNQRLEGKLASLRKTKGFTQLKLAEMMNVSRQAVSRWEAGAAIPSTENLKYLGHLYDVPLVYLLYDDAPEPERTAMDVEQESAKCVVKKKTKTIILILAATVIFIVILGLILFGNREEKPIKMDDMEGSEMVTGNDFELKW